MVPAVGDSSPAIMRSVVVLPQPDGPRRTTNSPLWICRSSAATATVPPNRFSMPRSWICASAITLRQVGGDGEGDNTSEGDEETIAKQHMHKRLANHRHARKHQHN